MTARRTIDVTRLPMVGFGWEAPIWCGQLGLAVIEGVLFAMLAAAYLYSRLKFEVWPPAGTNVPGLALPTMELLAVLASCIPMHWGDKAILHKEWGKGTAGMLLNLALGGVYLALRILVWRQLDFSWNSHLYGSLVWALLGIHTAHIVASLAESAVLSGFLIAGHREEKLRQGLNQDEIYWYFVAASGALLYAIVHLAPRLL
ncbi:MAG: cytochrome c oxidase subunit 3 [Bryobacteraceae bacterium]|nr:cytochrome c oxidase subunit 3 [Bryobacteraceae bacterium]